MKSLLIYLAKALVDCPEEIQVKEIEREKVVILELTGNRRDLGKIIGKQGRIIKAIKTIISAASAKREKKVSVEIIE